MKELKKANLETLKFIEEKAKMLTSPELEQLNAKIKALVDEREKLFMAQTMTEEQLLKLYNGYGYDPYPGDKFWKIRAEGKGHGFYGWQVGQFEHSCHVDTTNIIVLFVIEPGPTGNSYVVDHSDLWLEGPIVIGGKSKEQPKPKRRELDDKERAKGRSEGYWEMSAEDQWAEDKRLGILDWDGN